MRRQPGKSTNCIASSPSGRRRKHAGLWTAVVMVCVLALVQATAVSQDQGGEVDVGDTRKALEELMKNRRLIAQAKSKWEMDREILNERIALVQREIEGLRGQIKERQDTLEETEASQNALVEENQKLKKASEALENTVASLERSTQTLLKRLPEPITQRVKPLSQRLPDPNRQAEGEAGDGAKKSLSRRFQNVIGILNEINKFNGEVTVTTELRENEDGPPNQVTVMYMGIGQAYYVGTQGAVAGIGTAAADGWRWEARHTIAPAVAEAIAIINGEQPASFVQLPLLLAAVPFKPINVGRIPELPLDRKPTPRKPDQPPADQKPPASPALPSSVPTKAGFELAMEDGRLWVLRAGQERSEKHVTLVGAGPNRMTIKSADKATAYAYLAAKPGFDVEVEDGRLWVLAPGQTRSEKHVTFVGAGPARLTLKALDRETALLYLASKPGFDVQLDDDGRLWVFREGQHTERSEKHITRVGAGPMRTTVKANDRATLDAYLAD